MNASITVLPGDGIGPEITAQAARVLQAIGEKYGHSFVLTEQLLGGASIDAHGQPLTDEALKACQASDAVLLGAVGGEKWDSVSPEIRPERGLLALRKGLGVFANLRPLTIYPQLAGACPLRADIVSGGIDILMLRELTGDVYFGNHFIADDLSRAQDDMVYTRPEIERIGRKAFAMAQDRKGILCSVDKANVLSSSRLWREVMTALGKEYPDVQLSHMYVDNAAMQLILRPSQFDVIVTGNLFGDILSDESAAIAGSLGMMPSASLGEGNPGLYEPIHGSAPDLAGKDVANPLGTILSAAMLLRHSFGLSAEAEAIERAVYSVIDAGYRTGDIYSDGMKKVGCAEMGKLVCEAL